MNRHFEDERYYLKRAAETARAGVAAELAPVGQRLRRRFGREEEPEPSRLERLRADGRTVVADAEHEAKSAVAGVRSRLRRRGEGESH
jgi:hypothetical protein